MSTLTWKLDAWSGCSDPDLHQHNQYTRSNCGPGVFV
jgi:hypothetical protein